MMLASACLLLIYCSLNVTVEKSKNEMVVLYHQRENYHVFLKRSSSDLLYMMVVHARKPIVPFA